ncbi:hypothetical protein ORJ04_21300 [Rheinheimera baltica]|uniref:Uncharacterized protein n=1 Tax=Rheinheimera baltica TaxID=67576 RepID=A0ABT9I513_9GAMM|nr:hypothetical protein [Rheinheimera baltica]MDP5138488.1 hypothetical protein [Rheinheimera baltica]MDP5150443.1 hypothetical protein [Rheinheimera baltica]
MTFRSIFSLIALMPTFVLASDWRFENESDGFTDTTIQTAMYSTGDALAVIRCKNGNLDMLFGVNEYIGGDFSDVRVRFDKGDVQTYKWDLSTTGKAVFARADAFVELVRGFAKAEEMLLEVTKYTGTKFQRKISLIGITEPLSKVLKACPVEDNRISQAEYDEITSGVSAAIKKDNYKDKGPKSVKCAKEMLAYLGYPLKDMRPKWTREYFEQLKLFAQKNSGLSDWKVTSPYSLAVEKNPEFKEKCGYLRGFD